MKKLFVIVLLTAFTTIGHAQQKPINIIFDVTSSDVKVHQSTLRHVKMMSANYPDAKFEVVIYSGALGMVLKDNTEMKADIEKVVAKDNVAFVVCEMTLKSRNVDVTQLMSGVGTVPDGILEIATKQLDGWGYIKEAN